MVEYVSSGRCSCCCRWGSVDAEGNSGAAIKSRDKVGDNAIQTLNSLPILVLIRINDSMVQQPPAHQTNSYSSFSILVSGAEIPLYNLFNSTANALFPGSSLGRSNNALFTLDPSVVFRDKVDVEA
jgi:hypothetical protein